jgi:hypothetical protein
MGTFFLKKIIKQDTEFFLIAKQYLPETTGGN